MDPWRLYEYQSAYTVLYGQCEEGLQWVVDRRMAQLQEKGNLVGDVVSIKIKGYDGIYELRAKKKRIQVRFFYFFQPGKRIIFVHACFKDQKSMVRDYQKAATIRKTLLENPELLNAITEVH